MIHCRERLPERGAMTVLTDGRRLNMGNAFASGFIAVMAVETVSSIAGVVENSRNPGGCLVAIVTGFAGNYVIRRLAAGIECVVAGRAGFGNG